MNPIAGDPIRILNILDLDNPKAHDVIASGHALSVAVANITIDPKMPDEGIWLENQVKRCRQKRKAIARAEILDASDPLYVKCRFNDPLPSGKFMLAAGTRAGKGPAYKLRIARTLVKVTG